jgi:hypothetical protein
VKTKIHSLSDDQNYCLIAIASHLNNYKISWLLNEEMNFKFQQSEDLIVQDQKNGNTSKFGVFTYEEDTESIYTIYANRSGNEVLLKSNKNIDYILKYQGNLSTFQIKPLIEKLKTLKNILTVFEIDKSGLKIKESELFI